MDTMDSLADKIREPQMECFVRFVLVLRIQDHSTEQGQSD